MNAFAQFRHLHEYSDEEWELLLDVNIRYVFRVVRAAVPIMLAPGRGGSIVSVGSISGRSARRTTSRTGWPRPGW